jgi:hypothetical protein
VRRAVRPHRLWLPGFRVRLWIWPTKQGPERRPTWNPRDTYRVDERGSSGQLMPGTGTVSTPRYRLEFTTRAHHLGVPSQPLYPSARITKDFIYLSPVIPHSGIDTRSSLAEDKANKFRKGDCLVSIKINSVIQLSQLRIWKCRSRDLRSPGRNRSSQPGGSSA